jgi:hypothetical protein
MSVDAPVYSCPHCNGGIVIEQLNCGIFRHAVMKSDNSQINPHASKDECINLINNNLVLGCAGPIRWNGESFEKCDYI